MKYFKNNYKKMYMPTLFLTIVGIIIYTLIPLFSSPYDNSSWNMINIEGLSIYLLVISVFVPIYEYKVLKSKRGADLYYSLPLSKSRLNLQIYLKGLLQIVVSFIAVFILTTLVYIIKDYGLNYFYLFLLFLTSLIGVISLYSFNVFIFSKANNVIDGIIFVGIYLVISLLVLFSLDVIFAFNIKFKWIQFTPLNLIFGNNSYFEYKLKYIEVNFFLSFMDYFMFIFWSLLSLSLGALSILDNKNTKPENLMEKSNTYFGYTTLVPIITFTLVNISGLTLDESFSIVILLIILFAAYVLYVIYERSFKIKPKNILITLGVAILAIILNVILK